VEGDPERLQYLIADPALRRAVLEAMEDPVHSVFLEDGAVGLKIKNPFALTRSLDTGRVEALLRKLRAVLEALGPALEDVPDAPPAGSVSPGATGEDERDLASGLLMGGSLLFLILGGALLFTAGYYPPFTSEFLWQGLQGGGLLAVLYVALTYVVNRRNPTATSHQSFLLVVLVTLLGLPLTVYGLLTVSNGVLDSSPTAWIPARVEEIDYDDGQYSVELRAEFNGVRGYPELEISDRTARRLESGQRVNLRVAPGYWGVPWVAELRAGR